MKSLKLVLLSLVVVFLLVVVLQNVPVFMEKKVFRLDLLVWKNETPPISLSLYFMGFFVVGLLISFFGALRERLKAKNEIKNHLETIHKLEEEIKVLKTLPTQKENTPSKET